MPPLSQSQSLTTPSQQHHALLNPRSLLLSSLPRLRSLSSPLPPHILPTKVLAAQPILARTLTSLLLSRRDVDPSIIPTTYSGINNGPPPGTVVGIVFGSVAGFLLILWLIYTCVNLNGTSDLYAEETTVRQRRPSTPVVRQHRRTATASSIRSHRSEVIEHRQHQQQQRPVSRSPSRTPQRNQPRRETVIVEEETIRRQATPPEVDQGDNVVEVFEDIEEPRRAKSGRGRGDGYYRPVDPAQVGGGSWAPRRMGRG